MDTKTRIVLLCLCWLWLFALFTGLNAGLYFLSPDTLFIAMIFFLLVDLVFPRWGILLKVLATLILIHKNYYVGSIFDPTWLGWLAGDLIGDLASLQGVGGTVLPITSMFFSLLTIAFAQKLYFALLSRGRGALFLLFLGSGLLTGVYMLTGRDITRHAVAYAILGLLVMGTSKVQVRFSFPMGRWLSILLIWVLVITSVAWALPDGKIELSQWWEETLSWRIKGKGGKGKVGYGRYDGSLGGPLEPDDTPFLRVTSPHPVYLMGEARYTYTGHSWEPDTIISAQDFHNFTEVEGEEVTITVEFLRSEGQTLFVPRYPLFISLSPEANNSFSYLHSQQTFDVVSIRSSKPVKEGDTYTVTALLPYDDPEQLRELTGNRSGFRLLQLPPGTTTRTFELAQKITESADNNYDKAVAIVNYLRRGRWQYSLDTEYPPDDQDFVDWFLFEADRGYCVHFSTAFVVLARAAGVPARWVRGYSYGTRDADGSFIIQNQHAHAWAEVWFDGYGWVPFEPTPGASLPTVRRGSDNPLEPGAPGGPTTPEDPLQHDPGIEPPPGPNEPGQEEPAGISPLAIALVAAALLGLAAIILLGSRKVGVIKLYARLQARLRLFGWQRKEWETAREHLDRVQELPDRQAFAGFVRRFEESAYGSQAEKRETERRQLGRAYSLLNLAWHRIVGRR